MGSLVEVWLIDGCKPSHYWVSKIAPARDATAAAGLSFTLARGDTVKSLRLDGHSHSGQFLALSSDQLGATFIGIGHGKPGRYTITAPPGSVPLGTLSATKPARQQVTFDEDGKHVMHTLSHSSGGRGTLHLTPAAGARETRKIVARTTVDDSPIQDQVIARFQFAGTHRTGSPRGVAVRHRGSALLVSRTGVAGAMAWSSTAAAGAQQQFTLGAGHRSSRVAARRGRAGDCGRGRAPRRLGLPRPLSAIPGHEGRSVDLPGPRRKTPRKHKR